jgi:hypothetical protein
MSVREELLRRRRRECAARRRYLADLELLGQRLRADASQILTETAEEGASSGPAAVQPLIDRRARLIRSIVELDQEIATARASLAAAEQELRRHEFAKLPRSGSASTRPARRAGRRRIAPRR